MARMKFLCDAERCIECNGCVTACKNENEVPWGVNRRRVVTINDGVVGAEKSISVACMHCSDAPCMAVCPVDCFYRTDEGVVLHDKDLCIGCGYCFYACPFGAPQFPQAGAFGLRGKMDKCTFCAGGPEKDLSKEEFAKYGSNRLAQGKLHTKPWENGPESSLYTTSQWDQGNKTSWEAAVKTRNLAQNEYNRVE